MVWYSHLLKNFPHFVVIHTVKSFCIASGAEVDFFKSSFAFSMIQWMFGNLISGSFTFSKSSLYIWKFSVQVLLKSSLKDFEYYLASV